MQSAKVVFNGGGVTAELKDIGDSFELEVRVSEPDPSFCRIVKLQAEKESVRKFLDILLEAEEETEDVPDPAAGGGQSQGAGG